MLFKGTVTDVMEMMANRLYWEPSKRGDIVQKMNPWHAMPLDIFPQVQVKLYQEPTRTSGESRYWVKIRFIKVPEVENVDDPKTFGIWLVDKGGHYVRWTLMEAAAFLQRSMHPIPRARVSVVLPSAALLENQWGVKRRKSLKTKWQAITAAAMNARAMEYRDRAMQMRNKTTSRYKNLIQWAENLEEAAIFHDIAGQRIYGGRPILEPLETEDPDQHDTYGTADY